MKKIFSTLIIFLLFTGNIFAADEIEKGKTLLKSLSKKSLTKKETISFLKEYAVIIKDERGDGKVTYIFDDDKYSRYKGSEIISTDAWRFSKLGALRLFNKDIKMTWKIKISDKYNLINIKTKFDPVGKLYEFETKTKKEFLDQIEQIKQAEIQKKEAIEKAKIEKKKKLEEEKRKLEEERLAAEQKLEEEKRKLEEEKLALQKEIEELKQKKANELKVLQQSKKTPAQIKKEVSERKKQEKLAAKKKAKEEKERLKQEKLAAQKKAKYAIDFDPKKQLKKIPYCFGYISSKGAAKGFQSFTPAELNFIKNNRESNEYKIVNEMLSDPKIKKHLDNPNIKVAEVIKDYSKYKKDIFLSWVYGATEYKKYQSDDVALLNKFQLFCFI